MSLAGLTPVQQACLPAHRDTASGTTVLSVTLTINSINTQYSQALQRFHHEGYSPIPYMLQMLLLLLSASGCSQAGVCAAHAYMKGRYC